MAKTGFVAVVLSVNSGLSKLEKYELKVVKCMFIFVIFKKGTAFF